MTCENGYLCVDCGYRVLDLYTLWGSCAEHRERGSTEEGL